MKIRLLIKAAAAALLVMAQTGFGLSVSSYQQDSAGVTFTLNTGSMRVQVCQSDIVHVTYSSAASIPSKTQLVVTRTWPKPTFTTTESGDTITLQTARLKIKVRKSTALVGYTDLSNTQIVSEAGKSMVAATVSSVVSTNTITTSFTSPKDEGLFGLGQHMCQSGGPTAYNNYKGISSVLVSNEYGNPGSTYFNAVPVLISTRGYGIYWDNYSKSTFYGADTSNTRYRYVSTCGQLVDYYFFYGPSIDSVIAKYRTTTGSVPMFPKWCFGLIQSKDRYTSQADFLSVKNGYRNNKIPLDCIVQDWHYWDGATGGVQGCNCFASGYGDVKATNDSCHAAHVHTMISIWAEMQVGCAQYTKLNSMGALWPSSGDYHFIDPFDSAGREQFWNGMRDDLFQKQGWDAWWLDNDEPLAYPNSFGNRDTITTKLGRNALYYNVFPYPFTKMGYNNWRRDISGKRFVILHRANFAGCQAYSAMTWNNDINCNFGNLANSVPAGLGSTITGIPYWCTDIGGYWGANTDFTTASNRELMVRWFQYGVFQPVCRIHSNMKTGQGKELYSTTWDATTRANLLTMDKLRYRLMPYLYSMAWMVSKSNYTPMRHLVMDFTSDTIVKNIGNEYMFGPAFLVTPVTTEGATSASVYMPAGTWYNFWTGATLTGGQRTTVSAPLTQIPLLMRAGSIVPMGPEIQYATERADTIELRVYTGADGAFTLYEDEGDNYNYESGSYATIPITYNDALKKVTIGTRSGSFTGMLQNRVFTIVFVSSGHGVGEAITTVPDCIINYSGSQISGCNTGVINGLGAAQRVMTNFQFTTAVDRITLNRSIEGKTKSVEIYGINGKLFGNKTFSKNSFSLNKDFGLPNGTYIVKVKVTK
jgi:alpha-D-xyloside xylohydrolase